MAGNDASIDPTPTGAEWWRHAAIYQVYPRSWADADGDGVGDLPGITAHLEHLRDLGVDALWISPFYRSPQADHGYDVSDYQDIDPLFGTLEDADALVARAHELGLRLIVDLVPNHSSDQHEWFQAALRAEPGSPERARYLFRDGTGEGGLEPPNNWESVFGGSAWDRVAEHPDGRDDDPQWYLHLFDSSQPDFDWRNPEVGDMFEGVLRFWLDRGVDGFRVDVAHGLFKEESLRDQVRPEGAKGGATAGEEAGSMVERAALDEPMWDQPEVHEVYRRWHQVLAEYPGDRMMVAEAWTATAESMARFVRPDEYQQTFNFAWLLAPWSAEKFANVVTHTFDALEPVGATPTWVLSNHDVIRHVTRYGGGTQGLARARAATMTMLALPGSAYLYQGEELGLEQVDVAPEDRTDPSWLRTKDTDAPEIGRDGCRVPMPWSGDSAPFGFGPGTGQPWLPQPSGWGSLTVAAQETDPESTLAFYRRTLAARRDLADLPASVKVVVDGDVLSFTRGDLTVALNCGTADAALPDGEVVHASGPVDGTLPADTAVWVRG
ncbi:glycoside hydrolase family 13 protein [Nocardioides bruguierae]|uniref:glycoside hydrolase family 13 protein n=1 Tax=Nocardioides bruguierae TaxID=2945102 RepID=UPI002020D4D3|nr:glycoside hydrolase family 13 protein [Nocardioides bruguierae]MCL8027659.1 glycoside hydrolase family 13 protein [Nocardioides bruguierae]